MTEHYHEERVYDPSRSQESPYDKNAWATPDYIYKAISQRFDIVLDACASPNNAKHFCFLTKTQNSLETDWRKYVGEQKHNNEAVWVNPPYDDIKPWMEKAKYECRVNGFTVVLLVPATPDVRWFPKNASEVIFITNGRISFIHPETGKQVNGNNKGSMIIIFRPEFTKQPMITRYIDREELRTIATQIEE